ncbi:MAG: helix-turn-helix domain-containing protein [Anaerolineae bacterium]|nr:helix-turn-helix domain-containing protein [Anaerolineae bacterium]
MTDVNSSITVEDIRKQALPLGTRLVAGTASISRPVTWITVIYPDSKTNLKTLQRGEMVLVAEPERGSQRPVQDVDVIRWASERQASAVVLTDNVSPTALAEANAFGMPILILPPGSHIRLVEKAIVSLLVDRKGQLERRAAQIYRQLTQISSRNEGITELVSTIARLTNKTVVVQDKTLRIMDMSVQPQFIEIWDEIEQFLQSPYNLPMEIQDRHRVSEIENPVLMQSLPTPNLARLVSPIITNNIGRGYLSLIGIDDELDDIDLLVTEYGAAACALEMAKAKAISETEKRLRGTFLDRLLLGDVNHQEAIRQGERFEHDMTRIHVAIVLKWQGEETPSLRRLETLVNNTTSPQDVLVWQREKEKQILVFHATNEKDPADNSLVLARQFTEEVHRRQPGVKVAIGVGQIARDISQWRPSYDDAQKALELAVRLQTDTPLYIGDLGVYQLIQGLSEREKLLAFCKKTLGALEDYDLRQHADLIKTMDAFFACHGNLSQTAEMLIVHRNTLLYRMNRINEISEIDINRPETRLALHLALTIRKLLGNG